MPLTRPECGACGYSLGGLGGGDACPECGSRARVLVVLGGSRGLWALGGSLLILLLLSAAMMALPWLHDLLFPKSKSTWCADFAGDMRRWLRPAVGAWSVVVLFGAYGIWVLGVLGQRESRRRRAEALLCALLAGVGVVGVWVW